MQPFVTVLIPAYNASGTIRRAIDSALAQDYAPIEIVVVDDGSRDTTADVVAEYRLENLHLHRLPKNLGESGAMNHGILHAKGELIAFLDADDEWRPGKLHKQVALLQANPRASMATCGCLFVDGAGRPRQEFGMPPEGFGKAEIWRSLLVATCIAKPCVVARASAIRAAGPFDLALLVAADQDMWIRLAMLGEVEFVPEYLTVAHDTVGSLTKVHAQRIHRYVLPMIRRHIEARAADLSMRERRTVLRERYTSIGRNLYARGSLWRGGAMLLRAIASGGHVRENLWYLLTASPPAKFVKHRLGMTAPPPPPAARLAIGGAPRASLLAPEEAQLAPQLGSQPVLIVGIDAEAEFDWHDSFQRAGGVENLRHQGRAQALFDRFGVRPVYLVDYAAATTPAAFEPLAEFLREGRCEIGAHLQPWETPPFEEELGERTSFNHNLPAWLQQEKLLRLTEAIVQNFGVRPVTYRAGRYGVGEEASWILHRHGYQIDMSVHPGVDLRPRHGQDFRRSFNRPYWFGPERALLEIPLTAGFTGLLTSAALGQATHTDLYNALSHPLARRFHLLGICARAGLLERITLTPEGVSLEEMKRLTRTLLARGHRVFSFSYHSSSLLPGSTPYVRSAEDLDRFFALIEQYLAFFFNELGGTSITPSAYRNALLGAARGEPARARALSNAAE
jgi:glycosyltransferase involved in cell wall biosynthesis